MEFCVYNCVQNGNYTILAVYKSIRTGIETPENIQNQQFMSNVNNVIELTNNEIYIKKHTDVSLLLDLVYYWI